MSSVFENREPRRALELFGELSAIPRSSGNEGGAADWLEAFAKKNNLECYRDAANNVLLRYMPEKAETAPLLLQGHTDMVCVKESWSNHDFAADPLELFVDENGWLGAKGTTLGADDGIGVTLALALLEEKPNRVLECLFTTSEETGMDGAVAFDYSKITARQMLNLDSEDENEAIVSCAGGCHLKVFRAFDKTAASGSALRVRVGGFAGGHSGSDIHLGKVNAARRLAKLLAKICEKYDCRLIRFEGGEKDNAIPTDAYAELLVGTGAEAELAELFKRAQKTVTAADAAAEIGFERFDFAGNAFDTHATKQICKLIATIPNGVVSRYEHIDLVKTSLNTGVVRVADGEFLLHSMIRSSDDTEKEQLTDEVCTLAADMGFSYEKDGEYPSWGYAEHSPLRDIYIEAYRKVYGLKPRVCGIHAGLECGFIKSAIPDMDILSLGPTMRDIHTVNERLDMDSCARFMQMLRLIVHGHEAK